MERAVFKMGLPLGVVTVENVISALAMLPKAVHVLFDANKESNVLRVEVRLVVIEGEKPLDEASMIRCPIAGCPDPAFRRRRDHRHAGLDVTRVPLSGSSR